MILVIYPVPHLLPFSAQDLGARPAAQEMRETREEGPDIWIEPAGAGSRIYLGEQMALTSGWIGSPPRTRNISRNSGDGIAVVKVTVKDNDMVDTANEKRRELPEELLVQDNYPNPFRNANTNCSPPAGTGTGECRGFRHTWSCGLYFPGASDECKLGSHTISRLAFNQFWHVHIPRKCGYDIWNTCKDRPHDQNQIGPIRCVILCYSNEPVDKARDSRSSRNWWSILRLRFCVQPQGAFMAVAISDQSAKHQFIITCYRLIAPHCTLNRRDQLTHFIQNGH